jgi:hypothetical protein
MLPIFTNFNSPCLQLNPLPGPSEAARKSILQGTVQTIPDHLINPKTHVTLTLSPLLQTSCDANRLLSALDAIHAYLLG